MLTGNSQLPADTSCLNSGDDNDDLDESVCDDNPCLNGGSCTVGSGGSADCTCANGFSGATCETSVCDSNPCSNGGTCSIGEDGSTVCTCLSGYSGATCENENEAEPSAEDIEIFDLMNDLRAQGFSCPDGTTFSANPTPQQFDCRLWMASYLHSKDMAENGYFSHNSQDGRSPWDRASVQGISAHAENIAAGSSGAQDTLNQWLNSNGHCKNIGSAGSVINAVARAVHVGSTYTYYWTQMLTGNSQLPADTSCLNSGGDNDDLDESVCDDSPCLNGGSCTVGSGGSADCTCANGFSGATCETSVCDSNPCSNGGTCSIGGDGSAICTCVPGYSGSDCSESICDDAPCQNGGTCSVAISGSSDCACAAGYSGPTCTASNCDSNPCLHGGSCSIGEDGSTVCTCLSGYSGATCENENEASTKAPTLDPTKEPTNEDAGECASWCQRNSRPWRRKCNFGDCSNCLECNNVQASTKAPTLDPTKEPTIENAGECASWCPRSSQSWRRKCDFADCSNCLKCNDVQTAGCLGWCHTNAASWQQKCTWASCSGCESRCTPMCEDWCENRSTKSWDVKCKWAKCVDCEQCS